MKYVIPILREKHKIINGKTVTEQKRTDEEFNFDLIFYSQDKWEKHFPNQAKTMTFTQYAEILEKTPKKQHETLPFAASVLKFLFCTFRDNSINTFSEFTDLFQTSDPEYNAEILSIFKAVFEQLMTVSLGNLKN